MNENSMKFILFLIKIESQTDFKKNLMRKLIILSF